MAAFMKLGDIKGEFAPSRKADGVSDQVAQFTTGGGGDSLTGEDRPMNVWTNGSATSFEDRLTGDVDSNDVVIGVKENIDWTAANGGPGSSYLTSKAASKTNAYVDEDVDGFMKLGDIKGEFASAPEAIGADALGLAVRGPLSRVQRDGQTFMEGPDGQLLGPISGEGVFKPQAIDDQVGVIVEDNHFSNGIDPVGLAVRGPLSDMAPNADDFGSFETQVGNIPVQQVNGSIAAFEPMDSLVNFAGADAATGTEQDAFSGMNQGFATSPVNKLRSDNRFVIEPVNLFQGLDAGSMNYAEAIGMDSSTVGVMNNVISSLQPANEII